MNIAIKVALIGATGKAGKYLLKELLNQGYQVKALLRKPESFTISHPNLEIVSGDIKDLDTTDHLLDSCHTVISAIGQPKDEPLVSSLAAANLIQVMHQKRISRYVFLAGLSIDMPGDQKSEANLQGSKWMKETFPVVTSDKEKAVQYLLESDIEWTMVRLPWIEERDETCDLKVSLRDCLGGKIGTTDLANFVIQQLTDPTYIRKGPFIAS
ncbi:NAD(P)-dependent oxidoreductase [Pedobacter gandavensis]|uniref:NAD(P)H-binding protein n=1 Tax=Pedobacter gandavensis TaxID=2679963 RepID=A0ABR6EYU4_9SPHI|nr:NAD(P)H-binding protein [Pedobacter gandavensis]MBB2150435.1 NAD(P)H-binding protein [Pedobacter gandavensis]